MQVDDAADCPIDGFANVICFGSKFRLLIMEGLVCKVTVTILSVPQKLYAIYMYIYMYIHSSESRLESMLASMGYRYSFFFCSVCLYIMSSAKKCSNLILEKFWNDPLYMYSVHVHVHVSHTK